MGRQLRANAITASLVLALGMTGAAACAAGVNFSAGFATGLTYDDNVGVEGLIPSGEGDTVQNIDLKVGAKKALTKSVTLDAKYKYSSKIYDTFGEFDQSSHQLRGALKAKIEKLRVGVSFTQFLTELDGDDFLDMEIIAVTLGALTSRAIYTQISYSRYNKDFKTLNDRDAEMDVGNIETFFFFDHYRSFINMSASVEDERAFDPQLDYGGYKFGVSVDLAINKPVKGSALNLETAWRDRDYDNLTTSIGMKRKDESLTVGIGLETPVNDTMKFLTSYKYVDHSSNLPVSDYDEQIISVEFSSEF